MLHADAEHARRWSATPTAWAVPNGVQNKVPRFPGTLGRGLPADPQLEWVRLAMARLLCCTSISSTRCWRVERVLFISTQIWRYARLCI